jgi:hypothetical protein
MACKTKPGLFYIYLVITTLIFCKGFAAEVPDKNPSPEKAPKVFLDGYFDLDYIRTEIPFVNYVRDRKDADIHIISTLQQTGAGGIEYTLRFSGQKDFKNLDDEFVYISNRSDSDDERREGLARTLKMGLIRYIAKTPLAKHVSISFNREVAQEPLADKWKHWVFRLVFRTYLSGEASYHNRYFSGSFSADRVTPTWKLNFSINGSINRSDYEIDGETYIDKQENRSFYGSVVKSISDHWSYGVTSRAFSSTYENNTFSIRIGPAVEYDIFPYSESTRKLLVFNYSVAYRYDRYREETIYDKMQDGLLNHSLNISYVQKTKWGSFHTTLEGSQYFRDLGKNRAELYGSIEIRIIKGLSFDMWGSYSIIHDQLSIEKGDATAEEILLRQRQLATTYNYYVSIGFSYSFGSIYNNIVNPRFRCR